MGCPRFIREISFRYHWHAISHKSKLFVQSKDAPSHACLQHVSYVRRMPRNISVTRQDQTFARAWGSRNDAYCLCEEYSYVLTLPKHHGGAWTTSAFRSPRWSVFVRQVRLRENCGVSIYLCARHRAAQLNFEEESSTLEFNCLNTKLQTSLLYFYILVW